MTNDPDIIRDLLPLYRSGLASAASRRLVESWLAEHAPGAAKAGEEGDGMDEMALRALDSARRRSRGLRWLFGLAVGQTVLCLSTRIQFEHGVIVSARLLAFDMPW